MRRCSVALLLLLLGCANPFAPASPAPPAGAVAYTPPARYDTLWARVEACSGRTRDVRELRWYTMPERINFEFQDAVVQGVYLPHYAIVLADLVTDLDVVVMREMLHAVRRDVGHSHANADFQQRCAALIAP
jgi:hypothetical protein